MTLNAADLLARTLRTTHPVVDLFAGLTSDSGRLNAGRQAATQAWAATP
ncbi:MAG: hypothetical protein ACOH1Y_00480 [Propionicimonas sp.]